MKLRDRIIELRRVPASELLPNPKNWRTHPEEQANAMRGVLAEVGIADAVLARETPHGLMLIDGHLRADIAPGSIWPVLVLDVTEEEADKLLATIDPLAGMAEVDEGKLGALLEQIDTESEALRDLLDDMKPVKDVELVDAPAEVDRADELQKEWQTEPGQLWEITGKSVHRLMCGDSTKAEDVERLMGGEKADLVITSPPYNQNVGKFSKSGMHKESGWIDHINSGAYPDNLSECDYEDLQVKAFKVWAGHLTSTASLFYNHKNRFRDKECISPWRWLSRTGAKVRQEIIWLRHGSVTQNMRGFMPVDERIFWLYFGTEFLWIESTEHKSWSTVWKIAPCSDSNAAHGCAFPIELPARPIRSCSLAGQIVFDPFLGSGTTLIAAENLGRRCFGMEISPGYVAVAIERAKALGCECRVEAEVMA